MAVAANKLITSIESFMLADGRLKPDYFGKPERRFGIRKTKRGNRQSDKVKISGGVLVYVRADESTSSLATRQTNDSTRLTSVGKATADHDDRYTNHLQGLCLNLLVDTSCIHNVLNSVIVGVPTKPLRRSCFLLSIPLEPYRPFEPHMVARTGNMLQTAASIQTSPLQVYMASCVCATLMN
jgi:hypothetical protein